MRSRPLWTACVAVTITVTDVEETGSITLSSATPAVTVSLLATLTDPDGGITSKTWQWAKSDSKTGTFTDIDSATEDFYKPVTAGPRQMAPSNGVVHRPPGPEQDRHQDRR